jgi:hypothetical protein
VSGADWEQTLRAMESDGERIDRQFAEFHANNPSVYAELAALARQAKARGRTRVGIKMLYEVVRWQRFVASTGDDYFLNNNYHSRYARLLMAQEPDLRGLFELRAIKT